MWNLATTVVVAIASSCKIAGASKTSSVVAWPPPHVVQKEPEQLQHLDLTLLYPQKLWLLTSLLDPDGSPHLGVGDLASLADGHWSW